MEFQTTSDVERAAEVLRDEDNIMAVQKVIVALVTILEAEGRNHELNLTRAFREVLVTTDMLINPE